MLRGSPFYIGHCVLLFLSDSIAGFPPFLSETVSGVIPFLSDTIAGFPLSFGHCCGGPLLSLPLKGVPLSFRTVAHSFDLSFSVEWGIVV
jgi:hypothetical protein